MGKISEKDISFLEYLKEISVKSTCDRGRCSAIFVKDDKILVEGYAAAPSMLPQCNEVGHKIHTHIDENGNSSQHCVRTIHAEQNAICQAAKEGISLKDSTLYVNMTPCRVCAMLLTATGVKRVVCNKRYHTGQESEEILIKSGIELDILNDEIEKY